MISPRQLGLTIIANNPAIAKTPMGKSFQQALKENDFGKIKEMADNVLESHGMTMEEAQNEIKNKLPNLPFF